MKNRPLTFNPSYFQRVFLLYLIFGILITSCGDDVYNLDNVDKTTCQYKALQQCTFASLRVESISPEYHISGNYDPFYNSGFFNSDFDPKDEGVVRQNYSFDGKKFSFDGKIENDLNQSVEMNIEIIFSDDFTEIEKISSNRIWEFNDEFDDYYNNHIELKNIPFDYCEPGEDGSLVYLQYSTSTLSIDDVISSWAKAKFFDNSSAETEHNMNISLDWVDDQVPYSPSISILIANDEYQ